MLAGLWRIIQLLPRPCHTSTAHANSKQQKRLYTNVEPPAAGTSATNSWIPANRPNDVRIKVPTTLPNWSSPFSW